MQNVRNAKSTIRRIFFLTYSPHCRIYTPYDRHFQYYNDLDINPEQDYTSICPELGHQTLAIVW